MADCLPRAALTGEYRKFQDRNDFSEAAVQLGLYQIPIHGKDKA